MSRPYEPDVHVELSVRGLETNLKTSNSSAQRGKGVHWVTDASAEIPVKIRSSGFGSEAPLTVMQLMQRCLATNAQQDALFVKRKGNWIKWTWQKYHDDSKKFARALVSMGATRRDGVAILGFNSPEWLIANLGAIYADTLPAGIYTTNNAESTFYIAENCEAVVAVVEDREQLDKFLAIRSRLPKLRAIVVYNDDVPSGVPNVYSWSSFLQMGTEEHAAELDIRMSTQSPGTACVLIYTSGTTGHPKGVMLSHDNVTWTSRMMLNFVDLKEGDRGISYLPLSHIAAQMADIWCPMATGVKVYFAQPDALRGSLVDTLKEVRPTQMFGVPRVWEKIEERLRAIGAANTGVRKSLGDWAKSVGLQGNKNMLEGKSTPFGFTLANAVIFSKIKAALGLDECRMFGTGAAPIAKTTLEYFMSLNMVLFEMYGMSESSGPETFNSPGKVRIGSIGQVMPGTDLIVANPDAKGHGELCYRGRNVFMGYLKNDKATMEAVDEDGFLHSGDVGCIDSDGYVYITGRIKELLITAGGENVPPVLIEDTIKAELPILSNVMVIGDKMPYLSCLLTLKTEPTPDGQPSQTLSPIVLTALESVGSKASSIEEARACPLFRAFVEQGVERANLKAVSRAQHIRKWQILSHDFTLDGGELTPTMKLKRKVVLEKYGPVVDTLYTEKLHSKM
eukprot:GILJ01001765.1.p1 GENE.GILJ01001765.1~~GILJ01001765.1.p1  ORF type:complete len:678 (+),score=107.76 GILJ01001765.1:41-2074(+)